MLDVLKNMKYLKVILIVVGVILAINVIGFILSWWKLIALAGVCYVAYKVYTSLK